MPRHPFYMGVLRIEATGPTDVSLPFGLVVAEVVPEGSEANPHPTAERCGIQCGPFSDTRNMCRQIMRLSPCAVVVQRGMRDR